MRSEMARLWLIGLTVRYGSTSAGNPKLGLLHMELEAWCSKSAHALQAKFHSPMLLSNDAPSSDVVSAQAKGVMGATSR
jgi:hypothetical protein